jgi:L-rhamnose mutarotase
MQELEKLVAAIHEVIIRPYPVFLTVRDVLFIYLEFADGQRISTT